MDDMRQMYKESKELLGFSSDPDDLVEQESHIERVMHDSAALYPKVDKKDAPAFRSMVMKFLDLWIEYERKLGKEKSLSKDFKDHVLKNW